MTVKKVNDYFHLVVSLFFIGVFLVAPFFSLRLRLRN